MKKIILLLMVMGLLFISCSKKENTEHEKLKIVTTTTMLTDLVETIGGEHVEVQGLMGAGVDPHLYKASEGDVQKLFNADVIIYNGLHLEGKLGEVFEQMEQQKKTILVAADALDKSTLISSSNFASNYDPHIWFDINNWIKITQYISDELMKLDPENTDFYRKNAENYINDLQQLNTEITNKINELPKEKRILVTAHDAFNYFGKQHDFEVVGLQGLSTATEAGVRDVQKMADFIIEHDVKAIFVESSVPKRTIEALQASVKSKNHEVKIGGTLYSDALGTTGTPEAKYIGMYRYNVNTIINALK